MNYERGRDSLRALASMETNQPAKFWLGLATVCLRRREKHDGPGQETSSRNGEGLRSKLVQQTAPARAVGALPHV
jgi:hypothetical protein